MHLGWCKNAVLASTSTAETKARYCLVRDLTKQLDSADKLQHVEQRHHEGRKVIDAFKKTEFGGDSYGELHDLGYAVFPVLPPGEGSPDEPMTKEAMTEKIEDEFVTNQEDGGRAIRTERLTRIRSSKRFMYDLEADGGKFYQGEVKACMEAVAQKVAAMLRALHYGSEREVKVDKPSLLMSPSGEQVQWLHTDQDRNSVQKKLEGSIKSTRSGESIGFPPPYSAVCAFRDTVYLHVIEESHRNLSDGSFKWDDAIEVEIPPGHAILFHSCTVHSGASYAMINGRLHLYLSCAGDSKTADGGFHSVQAPGDTPPTARESRG